MLRFRQTAPALASGPFVFGDGRRAQKTCRPGLCWRLFDTT
jgi:hypothetical protein